MRAQDLAEARHCEVEAVWRCQRLGLLLGEGDAFPPLDLERGRLIVYAATQGIGADEIAAASARQGDLLGQF